MLLLWALAFVCLLTFKDFIIRLWHYQMIPVLPRLQLLGQHRECAALRGNGWGRKHSTVNYVFRHSYEMLYNYHLKVMDEMKKRGYCPNPSWMEYTYRGQSAAPVSLAITPRQNIDNMYTEHDERYLTSCLKNLVLKIKNAPLNKYSYQEKNCFLSYALLKGIQ